MEALGFHHVSVVWVGSDRTIAAVWLGDDATTTSRRIKGKIDTESEYPLDVLLKEIRELQPPKEVPSKRKRSMRRKRRRF
jgi:hypothetical protein